MVAIAIYSVDQTLRRSLEQLPRKDPAITLVGIAANPPALRELAEMHPVDVVLSGEAPVKEQWADWQGRRHAAWIVFLPKVDEHSSLAALGAGASAILPRSADAAEIVTTVRALSHGLVVFQRPLLAVLLNKNALAAEQFDGGPDGHTQLTAREIEVLMAMADGASNKEVARRLGISFHTAKFHVAAILDKLDADSRTEAVVKASQLGIVML